MKTYKVVKHIKKPSHKKIVGPRVVYLRHFPGLNKPYNIQVYKGNTKVGGSDHVTRSAAEGWIELNAKGAEFKDLTGGDGVRTHIVKTT